MAGRGALWIWRKRDWRKWDWRRSVESRGSGVIRWAALCGLVWVGGVFALASNSARGETNGTAGERPNVLWISVEDMSPNLGCYGDRQARTPRIDAFAKEGVRYTGAFATAPVCSPSRSCLITGMYATSLGTQRLRSQFPIPASFLPFTAALRAAGYYCSNNVKTDYNVANEGAFVRAAWDDSSDQAHWRGRKAGQPFFSVFNLMTTHQSRSSAWPEEQFEREVGALLAAEERHDPAGTALPPFYPDTAEARRAWARYHDCIAVMDKQMGAILDQLQADGLAESTIVFFFSDHGMGMPRGKRCLFDSGLHVPLLVRTPARWAKLAGGTAGSTSERLVSFVDFAPTVLSLGGIRGADHLQGEAFLGALAGEPRKYVFGARDRVDEAFDVARSVRDERWLYIRNFMPHLPWMQPEGYSDTSAFRRELKKLAAAGTLSGGAMTFAAPRRAREELYDTVADPFQLHNLAEREQHAGELTRLRAALRQWQLATRDAGLVMESLMWDLVEEQGKGGRRRTPWEIAQDEQRFGIERLLDAAEGVGRDDALPAQVEWLEDAHAGVRYWGAVGLNARARLEPRAVEALRARLADAAAAVRIEAAAALAKHGDLNRSLQVLAAGLKEEREENVLHAARALELLGAAAAPMRPAMAEALGRAKEREAGGGVIAMFTRFSLEAALGE